MGFFETMIFYHLVGAGVAAAVFLTDPGRGRLRPAFQAATAVVFWPLYLPILLSGSRTGSGPEAAPRADADDAMSRAISQVESELETAMASLDGWAEDVLTHEAHRFSELGGAWRSQAERVREIDRLLAETERGNQAPMPSPFASEASDRCRRSEQTRRENLDRLRLVRGRAHEDLMSTLAWVRELVSMIHLAKFTGAPASRAGELVAQIAAAVEGISMVTWQGDQPGDAVRAPGASSFPTYHQVENVPCAYSDASATSSPRT
jgi:hypothetical protein